jgi:hypothetical protein
VQHIGATCKRLREVLAPGDDCPAWEVITIRVGTWLSMHEMLQINRWLMRRAAGTLQICGMCLRKH